MRLERKTEYADPARVFESKERWLMAKGFDNAMAQTVKKRAWANQKKQMAVTKPTTFSPIETSDLDFDILRKEISPGIYRYILYVNGQSLGRSAQDRLELLEQMQEYMDNHYGEEDY